MAEKTYRVVTIIKPPFVYYDSITNTWSGYCFDMLNEIANIVKFNYTVREVDHYGNMDDYGNFNGMVKELQDNQADIALGALNIEAELQKVIDFSSPFYESIGMTVIRKRAVQPLTLFKFITIFDIEIWLSIIGSVLFTATLMWIFDAFSPYSYRNNKDKYNNDDDKRIFTLKESIWFCLTSLTPQGGGAAPKNLSGKLICATWWLFGFIILASYTANLAASLTIARFQKTIESLEDLIHQYKVQYSPIMNSTEHIYFQRRSHIEKVYYEVWKDMVLNDSLSDYERAQFAVWEYPVGDKYTKLITLMEDVGMPHNLSAAIERVRTQPPPYEYFLIANAADVRYLLMTECDLVQVGGEFSPRPLGIGLRKNTGLKEKFDEAMSLMQDRRSFYNLKSKWWDHNPYKKWCGKPEEVSDGLNLRNIGGIFIMIIIGILIASLTIIFEYECYVHQEKIDEVFLKITNWLKGLFQFRKKAVESFRPMKEKKIKK